MTRFLNYGGILTCGFMLMLGGCVDKNTTRPAVSTATTAELQVGAGNGTIARGGPYMTYVGPGSNTQRAGTIASGTRVTIVCTAEGTTERGPYGTTRLWDKLADARWISDTYVYTGTSKAVAPPCSNPPPPGTGGFLLPLPGGQDWVVTRGIGIGAHQAEGFYSLDIAPGGRNTRVLASAPGKVREWKADFVGRTRTPNWGNYLLIEHDGGVFTRYAHLQTGSIPQHLRKAGAAVSRGELVGIMGNTGYVISTTGDGTHLHFQVNRPTKSATEASLRDFYLDGRRLRDYAGGSRYRSSNAP